MITGNITISRRPDPDDLRTGVICTCCEKECDEVGVDESFDDQFGCVTCWGSGSSCCGSEVAEGRIFLEQTRYHTARKDHLNSRGEVLIRKGERYKAYIRKGYYITEDGQHHGINVYKKTKVK